MEKYRYRYLDKTHEAQAAIATGAKFVLFGERHNQLEDRAVFSRLIPEMKKKGISVIALEVSPKFNGIFEEIQRKIGQGNLSPAEIEAALDKEFSNHGIDGPEIFVTPHFGEIFEKATKAGIKIVGIDPRMDDPEFFKRLKSDFASDTPNGLRVIDLLGHDGEAADNASRRLAQEPKGSRMAILYGDGHVKSTGMKDVDRPAILSEELPKHGSVATAILDQPNSLPKSVFKNYHVIQPEITTDQMINDPETRQNLELVAKAMKEAKALKDAHASHGHNGKKSLSP